MAEIPTVHFKVTGRQPGESEVRELSSMPMSNKRPSKEEVRDATKWFFVGIIVAPIAALIGFSALNAERANGIFRLVVGFGGIIIGFGMLLFAIFSLSKMFRSAQKKTPAKSAEWFWVVSVMGVDTSVGERFGKTQYSLATMARMLPAEMDFSEKDETIWLLDFQNTLADAADKASKKVRAAGNLQQSSPIINFRTEQEQEISPGLVQVNALLTFDDTFTVPGNNNQNNKVLGDRLELDISQYYIRNGNVWFPYDLRPEYTCTD